LRQFDAGSVQNVQKGMLKTLTPEKSGI
jgi:hypothetical protein